jgi:hypothetical protein
LDAPGAYVLQMDSSDFNITTAGTLTGDWLDGLDGMESMSALIDFRAGAGGTTVRAYIQTSLDGGATPLDIACLLFTAADRRALNFSSQNPAVAFTCSDGALADNTQHDGVLGTMVRLKLVTAGTWINTVLAGRIVAR